MINEIHLYGDSILDNGSYVEQGSSVLHQLKKIDDRWTFESDDEVGFFFTEIKRLGNELNSLFETEVEDAPIKEKKKKEK